MANPTTPTTSTTPTPTSPATATPDPPPPTFTGPIVRYERLSPPSYGGGAGDAYVLSLGADSAFSIVFPDGARYWGWSGRYTRADSVIDFHYNAWSAAGTLGARGIVRGDTLALEYNILMQLTDFESGLYVRRASQ